MPDTRATLTFLKRLNRYQHEKPFFYYKLASTDEDASEVTDNLDFEEQTGVLVRDLRGHENEFTLSTSGFQILHHASEFKDLTTSLDIISYRNETADMLKNLLHAEQVLCYEARLRRNVSETRTSMDLKDLLVVQRPAVGAHIDYTFSSGPQLIDKILPLNMKRKYLKPGYRFRIVNTWRSLIPNLEDSPLAVCDSRSVDPTDLVPFDRIFPDPNVNVETYLVYFNDRQKWYWLDRMCPDEPLVMLMYDTEYDSEAKY